MMDSSVKVKQPETGLECCVVCPERLPARFLKRFKRREQPPTIRTVPVGLVATAAVALAEAASSSSLQNPAAQCCCKGTQVSEAVRALKKPTG